MSVVIEVFYIQAVALGIPFQVLGQFCPCVILVPQENVHPPGIAAFHADKVIQFVPVQIHELKRNIFQIHQTHRRFGPAAGAVAQVGFHSTVPEREGNIHIAVIVEITEGAGISASTARKTLAGVFPVALTISLVNPDHLVGIEIVAQGGNDVEITIIIDIAEECLAVGTCLEQPVGPFHPVAIAVPCIHLELTLPETGNKEIQVAVRVEIPHIHAPGVFACLESLG